MRIRDMVGMLVGGMATFVACAANVENAATGKRDDGGVAIDPVPDAVAGPTDPPTTKVTAACDKSFASGVSTLYYAEIAVPGRTKEDLSRANGVLCESGRVYNPPGYPCTVATTWVKDGSIASYCDPKYFVSLTFVIPPPL